MDMSLYLAPSLRSGAHVECHVSTRFSLCGIHEKKFPEAKWLRVLLGGTMMWKLVNKDSTAMISEELATIGELLRTVKPTEAEDHLKALVRSLSPEDREKHQEAILSTVALFLPKRRRLLVEWWERISAPGSANTDYPHEARSDASLSIPEHTAEQITFGSVQAIEDDLRAGFAELSERHIFQWSTFYRDYFTPRFHAFVTMAAADTLTQSMLVVIHREIAAHANEIFKKGYEYTRFQSGLSTPLNKSLAGLQRFLELPIELYSAAASSRTVGPSAYGLRVVCSALASGILEGYGSVRFGDDEGWQLLPRFPRSWAHYLGFITKDDLVELLEALERGSFTDGVARSVVPVVEAIDALVGRRDPAYSALPSLGQFNWESRRLEIALHPPLRAADPRSLEIQCYLDGAFINVRGLEEAANRGVSLIAGPLRADLRDWVGSHDILRSSTVDTSRALEGNENISWRSREILSFAIGKQVDATVAAAPLTYNFARDFPLHNPFLTRYFHVYRNSVRSLLRTFERRNGVRLWCSVRRSGKTTACFDLSATTGTSTVITQTCDSTDQRFEANIFYDEVVSALGKGSQVANDFFPNLVELCSPGRRESDYRYVFVLDEYETLFERLRLAARRDKEVRYTVVQPLLNQMVAFSRENLIVLIGQRPDAHYILMDQNQLSAYVEQDTFPLFSHGPGSDSEFRELLQKILTQRVTVDPEFANLVYAETAGHPFLTVKLLVELFDWMIKSLRPARSLHLAATDFVAFASDRLRPQAVGVSGEYAFFRAAAAEALSAEGRADTPWLHAIYSCLRGIAECSPDRLRCSRAEFAGIVNRLDATDPLGLSPEYLLSTGAQSNFFGFSEDEVWPRVPLLARICRTVRPKVSA